MSTTTGTNRVAIRSLAAIAAAVLLLGATACTAREPEPTATGSAAATKVEKFAIVTPENESDHGWNQAGLTAGQAAAKQLGIQLTTIADAGWDNTETVLSQVAGDGAQFIVAHASGFAVASAAVAKATGVPILVQDAASNIPGKLSAVVTEAQEGGYLAGIAAAMSTKSGTVGIVVSADDANWFKMSGGFAAGVRSVDPAIKILYASVGPAAYADSAGGKATAAQLIAAGADVIFGMGDGATNGYLQAVEAAPGVLYIADIGDVTSAMTDPSRLLTSVLWNYTDTFVQAIQDVQAGTYGTHSYDMTVGNGGLSLQDTSNLTAAIKKAVDAARADIVSGKIKPKVAASAADVKAIIAGN